MDDELRTSPIASPGEMSPKNYSSGDELDNSFEGVKLPDELICKSFPN